MDDGATPTPADGLPATPITPDYCRLMARYNRWQNRSIFAAADTVGEAARRADRGAFFGSIHATLAHLLWADQMWMSRVAGWRKPAVGISDTPRFVEGWEALRTAREQADEAILAWARGLGETDVRGALSWHSGALGCDVTRPAALCLVHFFNHQTHHRGQVHALLTAAGAVPEATDLFVMAEAATGEG